MRRLPVLALLAALGCSSTEEEADPAAPADTPAQAPAATKEQQIAQLRTQIANKRAELAQADLDLAKINAEREDLNAKPASAEKTNRTAELARLETESKNRKNAITSDIAVLQQQLQGLTGGPRPRSADEALDLALEADAKKEKEEAEKRKAREDAERSEEARKIAEAERGRQAELAAREREKLAGGKGAGADGSTFEERWADMIIKVRQELQKYKRW
jgi:chromosome segregation ATPase